MAQPFFVSRAWLHTSMYAPGALALESTHPSSLLLGLACSFGHIGCPFFVFSLGCVCPYTRPSRSSVAIAYDRHRIHPGQNLSFSGADYDIHHSTVSMVSFFDRSGVSLNATMQFTLLPVGCDRLRSPPYPPCERIFCPISVGSVAQCNNAIHAPTLGTRAKAFFLGCGLLLYK